ncbi:hypothetical protein Tco_0912532 [Tanacetum coccineum]
MEKANPPPTNNPHILQITLCARVIQEVRELQTISAYIDSRLESINQFLNGFTQQPNEIDVDDLEPDDESVDTPLVSPFLDSNDDSNNGEVLNELEEYGSEFKWMKGMKEGSYVGCEPSRIHVIFDENKLGSS